MKPGLWDFVKAAFNARPAGMFVPPNWVGVGLFAIAGLLNPGLWIVGAGLELGYLYTLVTNARFRRTVESVSLSSHREQGQARFEALVGQLPPEETRRFRGLEDRCREVLDLLARGAGPSLGLDAQGEGLGRLLWVYARLLLTRQTIERIVRESTGPSGERRKLEEKVRELEKQVADEKLGEDIRKSFAGQLEILQQRLAKQAEARQKLAFLDAELARVEQQVELIREQAALSADPAAVSERIDKVAATLGGTTQWIREQQQMYGQVEDLLVEPPPIVVRPAAVEKR